MVAMDENIVLKTDRRGHVRTPSEQREHAVAEWERGGLSARRFRGDGRDQVSDLRARGGPQAQGGRGRRGPTGLPSARLDRSGGLPRPARSVERLMHKLQRAVCLTFMQCLKAEGRPSP